jgi:hypothetical protein
MVWFIVLAVFCLLIGWLLFAPFELKLDTTVPLISVNWMGIGSGMLTYEAEEWCMSISVLFFYRRWSLEQLMLSKKTKETTKKTGRKKRFSGGAFTKMWRVLNSFEIKRWSLAMDTGDPSRNALLYPVNMIPGLQRHVHINFCGNNYLVLHIRNTAWRVIYAILK